MEGDRTADLIHGRPGWFCKSSIQTANLTHLVLISHVTRSHKNSPGPGELLSLLRTLSVVLHKGESRTGKLPNTTKLIQSLSSKYAQTIPLH